MKNIRDRLLTRPALAPITVKLFGEQYEIKRLSAAHLAKHDKAVISARDSQNGVALAKAHAQIVLDSIIDGDGVAADNTTAADLMDIYDNVALIDAANVVIHANFGQVGALEEAKNA